MKFWLRLKCMKWLDLADGVWNRQLQHDNERLRRDLASMECQYTELAYHCDEVMGQFEAYKKDFKKYALESALKDHLKILKTKGEKDNE